MSADLIDQLAQQIEDLTNCIESKETDLQTAAKFGSALLEENKKLQSEVASLKDIAVEKLDSDSRLIALESAHQDLIYQLQKLELENEKQAEIIKSQQGLAKKNFEQDQGLENDFQELQTQISNLKTENENLSRNNQEQSLQIASLNNSLCHSNKSSCDLKIYLNEMEKKCTSLEQEKSQSNECIENLRSDIDNLKLQILDLQESIDEYQNYKITAEEQLLTIEQLGVELEWLRDTNAKLSNQVSMTVTLESKDGDTGGKTLLNEIEDRRLELIKEHKSLAEKHAGLAQTHSASLYRQQKMQHHIARLSQLSNTDFSQEKVRLLEEQLAQTESEKIELEKRIENLQSKSYGRSYKWESDLLNDEPDSARLETLEFRIQTLIEECETLKKENNTIRLVKAGETDKLHQITALLLEKERDLDETKHSLANTKFELDELLLSIKESEGAKTFVKDLPIFEKENTYARKYTSPKKLDSKPLGNTYAVKTVKLDRSTVKEESTTNLSVPKEQGLDAAKATEDNQISQAELAPISENNEISESTKDIITEKPEEDQIPQEKQQLGDDVPKKKQKSSDKIPKEKQQTQNLKPNDPAYFTGNSKFYGLLSRINKMLEKYNIDKNSPLPENNYRFITKQSMVSDLQLRLSDADHAKLLYRCNLLTKVINEPDVKAILQTFLPVGRKTTGYTEKIQTVDEYSRAFSTASRKKANAQAWVVPGDGQIYVNGQSLVKYFADIPHRAKIILPFEVTESLGKFNVWGTVQGGGPTGQCDALAVAVGRSLAIHLPERKDILQENGLIKIDTRQVERKKTGQPKARKKNTWVKR